LESAALPKKQLLFFYAAQAQPSEEEGFPNDFYTPEEELRAAVMLIRARREIIR
jgi:hypothetical protein